MPKPEQINEFILQIAYDLSMMKKTGKYGPAGQKFYDFIDAVTTDGPKALENEAKRQSETSENDLPKRDRKDKSMSRGQRLNRMAGYQNGLLFKLEKLGDVLQECNYERANKMLSHVAAELDHFSSDYDKFKEAVPELIENEPVYYKFDKLFTEKTEFPLGKQLKEKLEGKNLDQPLEIPEEPKEFVFENKQYDDNDVPVFQINDAVIETQRKNFQLNTAREYKNLYDPNANTYAGALGACSRDSKKDGASINDLLARALAAARLKKQGAEYSKKALNEETEKIKNSPAFPAMTGNRRFVMDALEKPDEFDRVLKAYERESKAVKKAPTGPKSYSEYFRRHTWPNVPEGKEKEYLAKCISAARLKSNGTPFDLDTIRKDARDIQKQYSFKELTTADTGKETADKKVRRWLHDENIVVADVTLRDHRSRRIINNSIEPNDPTKKSWAGYRRMHTKEYVPQNASAEAKRLCLAKAMISIRGMADDKPFSVKTARNAAAALAKNPYFRAITRDPAKVDRALESGKIAGLFDEMADARKQALQAKLKPEERIRQEEIRLRESSPESTQSLGENIPRQNSL